MNSTVLQIYGFEGMDTLDSAPVKTFLDAQVAAVKTVQVKCYSCNGTGQFRSKYTGRVVGPCFTCKGTSTVSPKAAKAHDTKVANKAAAALEVAQWVQDHTDVLTWLTDNQGKNDFARSLLNQFRERQSLSERQVAAVRENLAKAARREEERKQAVIQAAPQGTGLDLSNVPEGMYSVPNGDTRLKVRISKPEAPSKWASYVFVSDGAVYGARRNYGRQPPGKTYSGEIVEQLKQIAADPLAASQAYGRLVGRCGICGRKLEDQHSVEMGIGPICRAKYF